MNASRRKLLRALAIGPVALCSGESESHQVPACVAAGFLPRLTLESSGPVSVSWDGQRLLVTNLSKDEIHFTAHIESGYVATRLERVLAVSDCTMAGPSKSSAT